jgi:hypothetical protein
MAKRHIAGAGLIASGFLAVVIPAAAEIRSTLADQKNVAVTIYNQDLALIKEQRTVALPKGVSDLALRDVSGQIRSETAALRALIGGDIVVLEQNFDFDLLTPTSLLQKFVGRKVGLVRTHPTTGAESVEQAEVLAANDGVILRTGERIETGIPGRLVFDSVPPNLRDRPTLVTTLETSSAGDRTLELSYLSGGLGWKADYVAELDSEDRKMDLKGWVTLGNASGTTYTDATLQLVAGNVHRVREDLAIMAAAPMELDRAVKRRTAEMTEESLFEYHLYTLPRTTTIKDNQTKQVSMLEADRMQVQKELVLNGYDFYYRSLQREFSAEYKVAVKLNFENKESTGLGKPLPAGIVRVYKRDSEGRAQFVGEDKIDHTPKNETVKLHLGDAFDVTAERKQVDWKKADAVGKYSWAAESGYEIKIKNAKKESVTVTVREPIPGDWQMLKQSQPHEKTDAHTAEWKVTVPAEGAATLSYRVLTRY